MKNSELGLTLGLCTALVPLIIVLLYEEIGHKYFLAINKMTKEIEKAIEREVNSESR